MADQLLSEDHCSLFSAQKCTVKKGIFEQHNSLKSFYEHSTTLKKKQNSRLHQAGLLASGKAQSSAQMGRQETHAAAERLHLFHLRKGKVQVLAL